MYTSFYLLLGSMLVNELHRDTVLYQDYKSKGVFQESFRDGDISIAPRWIVQQDSFEMLRE